jgi:predicted O-methyltransferase YrrM
MANTQTFDLEEYCSFYSEPESPLLAEITRYTNLTQVYPRMLSGHLQGRLLSLISKLVKPLHILEIGTFTGYSALCLAEGLQDGGTLITLERNPEMEEAASRFFTKSTYNQQIKLVVGDATAIIPSLETSFDLVFIDADKSEYLTYYHAVIEKVKPGGILLADNVLWGGKVLSPPKNPDSELKGIQDFNAYVRSDARVESLLLPIRDGISVIRKK